MSDKDKKALTPCKQGGHIFSGEKWAQQKRITRYFVCDKCGKKVSLFDLPPNIFHPEMEKAQKILLSEADKIFDEYKKTVK